MKPKTKDFVTLRSRKRQSGLEALYLDISFDGVRRSEYLKLYLTGGNSREERARDKETMRKAEIIRSQRILDLQERRLGLMSATPGKVLFWPYYDRLMSTKGKATKLIWGLTKTHILRFHPDKELLFSDITQKWVRDFCRYLDAEPATQPRWGVQNPKKKLKESSKAIYLSKLKEALECAVNDEIILCNPVKNLKYSMVSDSKEFLTIAELRKLSETPAKDPVVKRMFLFSCLTGLRWSDIVNLKWGNVHAEDGRTYISIRQQKTKGTLTLDLDSQAVALLGTREADSRSIFDFSKRNCNMRYHLLKWVERAGIKKHISFHCARHTFATVMLSRGVDIYTVSKLLGHASVDTTQVYLRLIDDSRQKAMEKIPKIMDLSSSEALPQTQPQ